MVLGEELAEALPEAELGAVVDGALAAVVVEPELLVDPESVLLTAALLLPSLLLVPLAASEPEEALSDEASAAVFATAASLVLLVPPELLRKSVTYQPEPLS